MSYPMPIQPYNFQAILSWWDDTFKGWFICNRLDQPTAKRTVLSSIQASSDAMKSGASDAEVNTMLKTLDYSITISLSWT